MAHFYIWWLNQQECEDVKDRLPLAMPAYIHQEVKNRSKADSNRRLWVSPVLKEKFPTTVFAVEPWPDTPLAEYLSWDSDGIMIHWIDCDHLRHLPGILTDMELNRPGVDYESPRS